MTGGKLNNGHEDESVCVREREARWHGEQARFCLTDSAALPLALNCDGEEAETRKG